MHAELFDVSVEIAEASPDCEGDDEICDAEDGGEPCFGDDTFQGIEYDVGDDLYFFEIGGDVFFDEGEVRQVVT
jgi:hypothetical protein